MSFGVENTDKHIEQQSGFGVQNVIGRCFVLPSIRFEFLGASELLEAKVLSDFSRQVMRGRINEFEAKDGFKNGATQCDFHRFDTFKEHTISCGFSLQIGIKESHKMWIKNITQVQQSQAFFFHQFLKEAELLRCKK